jgi:transposase
MIQLDFTQEDCRALARERFEHPHPHVRRKMEALWLKNHHLPHYLICRLCEISPNTLRTYFRQYQRGGVAGLKQLQFYRPTSPLARPGTHLEQAFQQQPPRSVREAAVRIVACTGIARGLTQVRHWIQRWGFRYRKVGMMPAKADAQQQAQFRQDKLEPRLREAQAGQRRVYFVDAAHFVLGPLLGHVWSAVRVLVRAPAGRQRFNVLGAVDAISHEWAMVCNDTYITASSVCALLWQLAARGGGPISLVLDNARYQRCAAVADVAGQLGIELLYLPPYSPNLNLIERLWKFTKKECLASRYYEDFTAFKGAIQEFLSTLREKHAQELDSLLTLNFQHFEKAQTVTA